MIILRAIDALSDRVPVVEADSRPADMMEIKPGAGHGAEAAGSAGHMGGGTTHVAVFDEGGFRGLVGLKELAQSPGGGGGGWIFGDLAARGSTMRIPAQTPLEEVAAALERGRLDAAAVLDDLGTYLGTVMLDDIRRRLAEMRAAEAKVDRDTLFAALEGSVIVAVTDAAGTIVEVNEAFCRISGYRRGELIGANHRIVNSGRHPKPFWTEMWRAVAAGETWRAEVCNRAKDGTLYWVDTTIMPVRDAAGKLSGYLAVRKDITERKRAETLLAGKEAHQSHILRSLPIAMYTCEPGGDYGAKWLGGQVEQISGFPPERFTQESAFWASRIHPDDRAGVFAKLGVLEARAEAQTEYRWRCADGEYRWFLDHVTLLRDAAGSPVEILGIWMDVTERKRAETLLAESEVRFRQIAENSGQVFWLTDWKERKLLYVSPSYEAVFDRSCESMREDRRSWLDAVHPEDRERIDRAFAEEGERGEPTDQEYRIVRRDGSIRWIHDRSIPIRDATGEVYRWVSVAEDITRRKQTELRVRDSEQRLDRVLTNIHDALIVDDLEGRLIYANSRFFQLFGIPVRDPRSITLDDYVPPDWRDRLRDRHARRIRGEPVQDRFEYEGLRADGTRVWLEVSVVPVVKDDRIVGTQSAIRDISDRKQAEARLINAERREALATLTAGIAHEFNSMLLAAATYLHGVPVSRDGPDASVAKAALLVQQAQSLSASLLELFAGPEQAAAPVLALEAWLPECIWRLAGVLPTGVRVEMDRIGGSPQAAVDPLSLEQVVRILLTNAADALAGSGEIHVSATPVGEREGDDPVVEIRIADCGPGIPESDRDRIFEPFFTTRKRARRSGLGLAIASRLVEQAGGSLSFEPNEPHGSVFVIRLRSTQKGVA
jgi:PAS domain S-box-containing protein